LEGGDLAVARELYRVAGLGVGTAAPSVRPSTESASASACSPRKNGASKGRDWPSVGLGSASGSGTVVPPLVSGRVRLWREPHRSPPHAAESTPAPTAVLARSSAPAAASQRARGRDCRPVQVSGSGAGSAGFCGPLCHWVSSSVYAARFCSRAGTTFRSRPQPVLASLRPGPPISGRRFAR
jgi:hypothetical protein